MSRRQIYSSYLLTLFLDLRTKKSNFKQPPFEKGLHFSFKRACIPKELDFLSFCEIFKKLVRIIISVYVRLKIKITTFYGGKTGKDTFKIKSRINHIFYFFYLAMLYHLSIIIF